MKEVKVQKTVYLHQYAMTLALVTQLLRQLGTNDAKKIIAAVDAQL